MKPGIFISYRREDTEGYVRALYNQLSNYFDKLHIFIDVNSINAGDNFVEAIDDALASSGVVIALIGKRWRSPYPSDKPDYVRHEIAMALRMDIRVIPVLVADATMPEAEHLPADMSAIAHLQACRLRNPDFDGDVEKIIQAIRVKKDSRHVVEKTSYPWRWAAAMITLVVFLLSGYGAGAALDDVSALHSDPTPTMVCTAIWVAGVAAAIWVWKFGARASLQIFRGRTAKGD